MGADTGTVSERPEDGSGEVRAVCDSVMRGEGVVEDVDEACVLFTADPSTAAIIPALLSSAVFWPFAGNAGAALGLPFPSMRPCRRRLRSFDWSVLAIRGSAGGGCCGGVCGSTYSPPESCELDSGDTSF